MPKVSKESATGGGDFGPVVDRNNDVAGYRIGFTEFRQDVDATPLMEGLPDGMCQCPHWGYVLAGKVTFRFADGDDLRGGRRVLHASGPHPRQARTRHRVRRVQPDRGASRVTERVMMSNMHKRQPA
jgi:hypothetical protein